MLRIDIDKPWTKLSGKRKDDMIAQLKRPLVLLIVKMIQNFSYLLAGAEQKIRDCIYNSSSTREYWGGLQIVLM